MLLFQAYSLNLPFCLLCRKISRQFNTEEKQSVPALPAPQGDLLLIRGLEKKRQRVTLTLCPPQTNVIFLADVIVKSVCWPLWRSLEEKLKGKYAVSFLVRELVWNTPPLKPQPNICWLSLFCLFLVFHLAVVMHVFWFAHLNDWKYRGGWGGSWNISRETKKKITAKIRLSEVEKLLHR